MWTATLKGKSVVNDKVVLTVEFSNGVRAVTENISVAAIENLKAWVAYKIDKLTAADTFAGTLTVDTAIDAVPMTASPTDLDVFLRDFERLEKAQRLIDLGIIAANNAKVVALKTKIQNEIRPEYIDAL